METILEMYPTMESSSECYGEMNVTQDNESITMPNVSHSTNMHSAFTSKRIKLFFRVLVVALIGGTVFGIYSVAIESTSEVPRGDESTPDTSNTPRLESEENLGSTHTAQSCWAAQSERTTLEEADFEQLIAIEEWAEVDGLSDEFIDEGRLADLDAECVHQVQIALEVKHSVADWLQPKLTLAHKRLLREDEESYHAMRD